jgi:hypothetical protein
MFANFVGNEIEEKLGENIARLQHSPNSDNKDRFQ